MSRNSLPYTNFYIEGIGRFKQLPLWIRVGICGGAFLFVAIAAAGSYILHVRAFSGGSGTWDDPYVIANCTDLQAINDDPDLLTKDYVLSNDIDCTGVSYVPIGTGSRSGVNHGTSFYFFKGRFDGAGHTIKNVTINLTGASLTYGGIFVAFEDGYVHNLLVDNVTITASPSYSGNVLYRTTQDDTTLTGIYVTNSNINGTPDTSFTTNDIPVLIGLIYSYNPTTYAEPTSYTPVTSCAELSADLMADPHGWYSLSNDIDCAGNRSWIPFATTTESAFNGRLEGNGHTISGVSLDLTGSSLFNGSAYGGGLFDAIYGAVIQDVTLAGSGISDSDNSGGLGALAGTGVGFVLQNVHSTVPVSVTNSDAGGFVANGGGTILNSSVHADVTPTTDAFEEGFGGGLMGEGGYAHIENSTYEGTIIGYISLGGILGSFDQADINNVHATTTLSGVESYGGIIGWLGNDGHSTISNSSADTVVTDAAPSMSSGADYEWFGGIGGFLQNADLTNVWASTTLTLVDDAGGDHIGGIAGELDSYTGLFNATTTNTHSNFNATLGDGGDGWAYVGGIFGLSGSSILNSSASSTIVIGVPGALATDAEKVGGIAGEDSWLSGIGPTEISNSNATTTIIVAGDTANTFIDSIGGLSGFTQAYPDIKDSYAVASLDLTGNDVEEIGGLAGSPDDIYSSSATSTITINGDPTETYIDGVGGLAGFPGNITDSRAFTTLSLTGNDVEEIGGLAGGPGNIDTSSADALITITSDPSTPDAFIDDVGGLAGDLAGWSVSTSFASTTISILANDTNEIGGLAGYAGDDVDQSYASSTINISSAWTQSVACLLGETNTDSGVDQSFAQGSLTVSSGQDSSSKATKIGGLVGEMPGGNLSNSYSTCSIDSTSVVPGALGGAEYGSLVGEGGPHLAEVSTLAVTDSYATGLLAFHDGGVGSFFQDIGGLVGSSTSAGNSFEDSFAAASITAPAGSSHVGAFIGSYKGGETFSNDAYSLAATPSLLCTGIDGSDSAWCASHAESADFYDSTNAPLSSWDFSATWQENVCTYPTLQFFSNLFGSVCGGGGGGGGSTAPTVSSAAASSITDSSATLNGSIDTAGSPAPTVRGFVYGTSATYTSTTTESGSFSTGSFSAGISSLSCATTYHFTSYATNTGGTAYGSDTTFTTSACSGGGGGGSGNAPAQPTSTSGSHGQQQGSGGSKTHTTPPVISNVQSSINSAGVTKVTWNTDVPATTELDYGPSAACSPYTAIPTPTTVSGYDLSLYHVVTLPAAACKNSAHFSAVSADANGNRAVNPGHSNTIQLCPASAPEPTPAALSCGVPQSTAATGSTTNANTHTTTKTSDTTTTNKTNTAPPSPAKKTTPAPVITGVTSDTNPSSGVVTISWNTDVSATTGVSYGPTNACTPYTYTPPSGSTPTTSHVVVLPPAACKNSAHFSAISADAEGNRTISPGHSNTVQECPATSSAPSPEAESCTPSATGNSGGTGGSVPVGSSSTPAATPAATPDGGTVVVNGGDGSSDSRTVIVTVTPPPGSSSVTVADPDDPLLSETLPVTSTDPVTVDWDLCTQQASCADGPHAVSVVFGYPDGHTGGSAVASVYLGAEAAGGNRFLQDIHISLPPINRTTAAHTSEGVATVGAVIALLGAAWTIVAAAKSAADVPLLLSRSFSLLFSLGFLGRRRKGAHWGTVYDSVTKRPLDPVLVSLLDMNGKALKTQITDLDGRFGFLVDAGTYQLSAGKSHHTFPAHVAGPDPVYTDPYTGGPILEGTPGVLIRDIPLDPVDFDWNEEQKYQKGLYRFFSRYDRPLAYASRIFLALGALTAAVSVYLAPAPYSLILLAVYAFLGVLYLAGFAPRLYGAVRDALGNPLAYAVIRARTPNSSVDAGKAVSDAFGRYYLLLPPETAFDVSVELPDGAGGYKLAWQGRLKAKRGYMNGIIRMS